MKRRKRETPDAEFDRLAREPFSTPWYLRMESATRDIMDAPIAVGSTVYVDPDDTGVYVIVEIREVSEDIITGVRTANGARISFARDRVYRSA